MYTFLFKVNSYYDEKEHTSFHQLRANTFAGAVQEIEHYYGDELVKINVIMLDDCRGEISEAEYNRILTTL